MVNRLPRLLLISLGLLGVASLLGGWYLERFRSDWLALHPITTNLIASLIAFSVASMVVGVGFNSLTAKTAKRDAEGRKRVARVEMTKALVVALSDVIPFIPVTQEDRGHFEKGPAIRFYWMFHRLGEIDLKVDEFGKLVRALRIAFYNEVLPYAENYLMSPKKFDRTLIRDMEECLRETGLFIQEGGPAALPSVRHNLGVFGDRVIKFIDAAKLE